MYTNSVRWLHRVAAAGFAALFATSAFAVSPDVVISQVYGGGGNTGATYKNDFIELHNRGASAVNLNGWSVQYGSASGTTWSATPLPNITLQPGQYFLVQEAAGTGGTVNLPTPDATGSLAMGGTAGKVALATSTTALSGACPTVGVKDMVGYGTTNCSETASVAALSNTTAALRASNGCTETDNNSTDFTTSAPTPRNTATTAVTCGPVVTNGVCGTASGQTFTTAPTANLCTAGTASAVAGSGPWSWTCASTNGGTTASCSANKSNGGPFTIFHINDTHARITPHKWVVPSKTNGTPVYENVGGAAFVAGKMLALTAANPNALVIDAGDISEGNPIGDFGGSTSPLTINGYTLSGCAAMPVGGTGSSNCGMTQFYQLLSKKLQNQRGRGMDAVVVGNHDVRDLSYIQNLDALQASGVPVLSVNVRDIATHQPHFAPYNIVTVNGTKVGILGYTTSSSQVGASLSSTLEVVDCDWSGTAAPCHLSDYVNTLRNVEHVDVVVLVAHIGHGALVDQNPAVGPNLLVDNGVAKLPEVVVTGHWHTWAETVWQPMELNYKTIFTESGSYMKYLGELNVDAAGKYVSATQHVMRNADITPDADVQSLVSNLTAQYDAAHPGLPSGTVIGYTADNLVLDNDMRWWSPDEYPWSGNNTAGQWIVDGMKWKCAQLFGSCDLALEAGGGVRSDIPAGPVTLTQVYETFPWSDDTFHRINMTGQDLYNFLKETNLNAGFSRELHVTAVDGVPTQILYNGAPVDLNHVYTVAINNYMYAHPPSGYTWPDANPLTSTSLVRDGLIEFMQTQHSSEATAYTVGGARYAFNGEFSGGYRMVVTMMSDQNTRPTFDAAFVRMLSATPDTLLRRGGKEVPSDLVNADGSVNSANRLSSQEIYRSHLGFKTGALVPGDIVEFWGKASFYGGNPEFVDQEGIYADGVEFKIVGHDASLAKPEFVSSIAGFLDDNYKNHYVRFLAKKSATANTVTDQYGQSIKLWDKTGYAAKTLPGATGDTLEITGVLTMENYGFRLRSDNAVVTTAALPVVAAVSSHVDRLQTEASSPIMLTASASIVTPGYALAPIADAQVASGNPTINYGSGTNLYLQSSSSGFGNERGWLKFDLSSVPAGSTITGATLQLWNWKSAGAALPVEVRSGTSDSWTESGLNWSNQPAFGGVLDTKTLVAGTTNVWYNFDVTSFVQSEFSGDKTVSLVVKPVTEGSADATAPSYGFDAREYGSNAPVLVVTTSATASSVSNVKFYYRYSVDTVTWGAWMQTGVTDTATPYSTSFNFPSGDGYYEFYSVATDNLGGVESTPAFAQASVHYQAATGKAQSITFNPPAALPVNSTVSLSATATSGLTVTFTSQTAGICSVSGSDVTTLAVGNCDIKADQAGDPGYFLPASTTQSITVTGLTQTISFPAIGNRALGSEAFAPSVSATSGLAVTLASLTPTICTVNGANVTLVALGTCTLQASQSGNETYGAASPVSQSFIVDNAQASSGDSDTPLPAWALFMLGAGLLGAARSRSGSARP